MGSLLQPLRPKSKESRWWPAQLRKIINYQTPIWPSMFSLTTILPSFRHMFHKVWLLLKAGNSAKDQLKYFFWSTRVVIWFQEDPNIPLEHTPAIPKPPNKREILHKLLVGGLGYVPGVCWKILRLMGWDQCRHVRQFLRSLAQIPLRPWDISHVHSRPESRSSCYDLL